MCPKRRDTNGWLTIGFPLVLFGSRWLPLKQPPKGCHQERTNPRCTPVVKAKRTAGLFFGGYPALDGFKGKPKGSQPFVRIQHVETNPCVLSSSLEIQVLEWPATSRRNRDSLCTVRICCPEMGKELQGASPVGPINPKKKQNRHTIVHCSHCKQLLAT